jgi:Lrp/AsnC family transcriptional regulator for asnA, asnC and gidA
MINLDLIDDQLIKLLEQNAWQSSKIIAKQLKVSSATIRRRIRRLTQNGVLRAVAIADVSKVGTPLTSMVALNISHESVDSVMRAMISLPEVKWVASTTGRFDILALTRFHSTEELFEFLRGELPKINGVKESETFICLHVIRGSNDLGIS